MLVTMRPAKGSGWVVGCPKGAMAVLALCWFLHMAAAPHAVQRWLSVTVELYIILCLTLRAMSTTHACRREMAKQMRLAKQAAQREEEQQVCDISQVRQRVELPDAT